MMDKKNDLNIIFIVMDALRARNLGCYGYGRETSPNIDSLARKGVLFKNAFSSNNATDKASLSILSSRHILLDGQKNLMLTNNELNVFFASGGKFLQEILKKKGYKTYCLKEVHSWQKEGFDYFYPIGESGGEKKNFWKKLQKNQKFRDFSRMLVHHLFPKKIADKIKANYGRTNAIRATEDAIKIIKKSKKDKEKFFIWVDYNDTHIPYNPKQFTGKFKTNKKGKSFFKDIKGKNYHKEMVKFWEGAFNKKDTIEDIIDRYDSALFYDDFLIGKLVKNLKETDQLENTLIFMFSDHGESFGEHKIYWAHHGLYDVTTHFPLIISGGSMPKNKKINGFVQHEDLVPTVLDELKIKYDPNSFDGKSLVPLINGKKNKVRDFVFLEEGDSLKKRAIRDNKYKYIEASSKDDATCNVCNNTHGGIIELYDLQKDPEEKTNIAKNNKKTLIKMKTLLEKHIKQTKKINEKRRIKKILSDRTNKK